MNKRISPYTALKTQFSAWVTKALNRKSAAMWSYPFKQLNDGWNLSTLYERVRAADQLGYEVKLRADNEGLHVIYVEKLPTRPFDI